jgi:hypothetical protein
MPTIDEQIDACSAELAELPGWVKLCSIEISCIDPQVVAARGLYQKLEELYRQQKLLVQFTKELEQ